MQLDGIWYYIEEDGAAAVGWHDNEEEHYLFEDDGAMTTGWHEMSGKRYYLEESGRLAPPDGCDSRILGTTLKRTDRSKPIAG